MKQYNHTTNTGKDVKRNGGIVRVWARVVDLELASLDRMRGHDAL